MSRVHDMGGRFGDGPVQPEDDVQPFHEEWHKRALAVTLAAGALGKWNIDVSRHARECLAPQDYARFSYYEKWMAGLADMLVNRQVVSADEMAGSTAPTLSPLSERCLKADQVAAVLARGGPADRRSDVAPLFGPGQRVRTRPQAENLQVPGGHTRLPAYAAGAEGVVLRLQGSHVLPDSNAHDLGEAPEPLYAVAFAASELWAHPEHPDDQVVLDLWQSYLEPA
jgi:nitrile hydratase subunit beta